MIVYVEETDKNLSKQYYLVVWKGYPIEKNILEPFSAIMYIQRIVNILHKDYLEKLIVTSTFLDFILPMAKLTVKFPTKQK